MEHWIVDLQTALDESGLDWVVPVLIAGAAAKLLRLRRRQSETVTQPMPIRRLTVAVAIRPTSAELKVAAERMRHLSARGIKPLPLTHAVDGKSSELAPQDQRGQHADLALQVLAVQMWHAGSKSALPHSMSAAPAKRNARKKGPLPPRFKLPRTISWASRITLALALPWALTCMVFGYSPAPHAWVLALSLFIIPLGIVWLIFRAILGDRGCIY